MKFFTVYVVIVAIIAIEALPKPNKITLNVVSAEDNGLEQKRIKRASCDLLSHWVGSAACAAHCYTLGKKGGFCDAQEVCNCRKN